MKELGMWVLLMWTDGQGPTAHSQEFTSQAKCDYAVSQIISRQSSTNDYRRFRMICTEK
jgi:hypothetical protein